MNIQPIIFRLTQLFVRVYGLVQDHLGLRMPGLGRVLGMNREDHVFVVKGQKMFFDHRVAASYCRLVAGSWNEPETHVFLDRVLSLGNGPLLFVDAGASIGEFVIDVARSPKVLDVIAFEPIPECADALRKSASLNGSDKVRVIQALLNSDGHASPFYFNKGSPTSSGVYSPGAIDCNCTATSLDAELKNYAGNAILLVDVEGSEPDVLKGGIQFIARCSPLIIFEYNEVSRCHFQIEDIHQILGNDYLIYRLADNGSLDLEYSRAWNCVAVNRNSVFKSICT